LRYPLLQGANERRGYNQAGYDLQIPQPERIVVVGARQALGAMPVRGNPREQRSEQNEQAVIALAVTQSTAQTFLNFDMYLLRRRS
jgi:hypothetical protein